MAEEKHACEACGHEPYGRGCCPENAGLARLRVAGAAAEEKPICKCPAECGCGHHAAEEIPPEIRELVEKTAHAVWGAASRAAVEEIITRALMVHANSKFAELLDCATKDGLELRALRERAETAEARIQELEDTVVEENQHIFTMTGVPRGNLTLQQEIRAQLEEATTERDELQTEVKRLREALRKAEAMLSLLRHRGGVKWRAEGETFGVAEHEADSAISAARVALSVAEAWPEETPTP